MSPLELAARRTVCATDVLGVAAGRKPSELWIRSGAPGGIDDAGPWSSDAKGVEIAGERVTWREIHGVIAAGITDEIVEQVRSAYRVYVDVCMEPIPHEPGHADRYRTATAELRRLEQLVVDRGLGVVAPDQGSLFEVAS